MEIKVKLFGKAREFSTAAHVFVSLQEPARVSDLRAALAEILSEANDRQDVLQLVGDCALGDDTRILKSGDEIHAGGEFVLLPPVCGG